MGEAIRFMTVLLVSAALCTVSGCMGEGVEDGDEAGEEAPGTYSAAGVAADTAAAVDYQVFDSVVHSQNPRKLEFRLLALQNAERASLSKTLRLTLDSIGRTDSTLVAARAVLYLYDPAAPRRGNVTPRLWGEWVPPVGWDRATAASRRQPYVVYIYNTPLWGSPPRAKE